MTNLLQLYSHILNRTTNSVSLNTKRALAKLKIFPKACEGLEQYEDKIKFNSVIDSMKLKLGDHRNRGTMFKMQHKEMERLDKMRSIQPLPISLKYLQHDFKEPTEENSTDDPEVHEKLTQFPFSTSTNVIESSYPDSGQESRIQEENRMKDDPAVVFNEEVRRRNELSKDMHSWMTAYDNYDDGTCDLDEGEGLEESDWKINYGTPDPTTKMSDVPCGGCGALLHCKDTSIPGYLPSEIFKNYRKKGATNLGALICQRCYFLKTYNLALQVHVSPYDYPRMLNRISEQKAAVVLMVDLLDFPCSIWPGIADIIGHKTPVFVVGNKIDLIPKDCPSYQHNIKKILVEQVKLCGFGGANLKKVCLISAKTGYGIEELISRLHSFYSTDVYLVGCTNVGKSSLFNSLLQSDFCKVQSVDLIQRATISQWPGTTLNLLKFPIMRPHRERKYMRHLKLMEMRKLEPLKKRVRETTLRENNTVENATLLGHIGLSYDLNENDKKFESFSMNINPNAKGKITMGVNENDPKYAMGRWCFDTPGVVQPDQIVHLLTAEELMLTLPKQLIRPETFCVKPGTSLFIAGLARLDYLEGHRSVRLTVFRSNELPITICDLENADSVYEEFLTTKFFKVPENYPDRLSKWPGLQLANSFTVTGVDWSRSAKDVVLSSAGWVAINGGAEKEYKFQAWTPEKRGCYVRNCLLPDAVDLRGARIRHSPAYKAHKFI